MRNKYYTSRDPIKNYFPLPNEVFALGLSPGALAVYSYLMYIEDRNLQPLQIFLRNILILDQMEDMMGDPDSVESLLEKMRLKESMKFGIVVLSSLPVLIMYPFLQKYFMKGVMLGSVKG